jgi:hypothetical protein
MMNEEIRIPMGEGGNLIHSHARHARIIVQSLKLKSPPDPHPGPGAVLQRILAAVVFIM